MTFTDALAGGLLITGAVLALTAAIGLVRFPDVLTRMHAATKPQTVGLLCILAGLAIRLDSVGATTTVVLIAAFQLLTTPVSAHMVGRAAFRTGHVDRTRLVRDDLTDDGPGGAG